MKNRHSAKRVARDIFVGATLHSFDPGWSFNYPSYLGQSTFSLPDWAVGILAERLGLVWIWGNFEEAHPTEQMQNLIKNAKQRMKESQNTLHEYSKYLLDKEDEKK